MFSKFKVKMDEKKSIGKVFNPLPPIAPETTVAEIKKVDDDAGKNNGDESNQDMVSKSTPLPPIASESSTKQENEEEELGAESEEEDEEYAQSLYENVGKIKQKSVDEVMEDLKSVVFPRLSKYRRFNSKAALYDVWFVSSACSRFYGDTENYVKVAEQITSLKFVKLIQKLLKRNFDRLFDSNYLNGHLLTQTVTIALSLMWNLSDKSVAFVKSILDHNLPLDLFKYMQTEQLVPGRMAESKSSRMVQPFIGTLHNVVQKAPEAKQVLRACGAVELLQPFRECSNEKISCVSLMVQAYLVTEEENERLNSNSEVFEYLIKHLDASMQNTSIDGLRFAAIEIVDVINRLAASDNNKRLIVDSGVLEYYAKLMDPDWKDEGKPGEEDVVRAEVAHGLWILAFKCKDDILKHAECMKGLEYLANSSAEEVRKNAEGALWILKAVKASATSKAQTKHIFFSYQRDNLDAVSRINTRLKESGFKTWIDIDDMSNSDSCLEGMAIAVENASMVIICYSEKYKDSANCRTEAEYAFRLKKPVIPLRFQTGYYPDGWLGILIGSKLVYDCSPIKFEDSVKNLIKELHRLTSTASSESVDGLEKRPMQPSHERSNPVSSWNKETVDKWIEKNNLSHMKDWLSAYNGDMLLQFQRMRDRAPEAFYAYFVQNKFPLLDAFAISKALDDLT